MPQPQSYADFKKRNKNLWKSEIIKVAVSAFKQKGYHGTTMDDIARQLQITKGSLYYYFKNKEAILFGCHMASLDIVDKAIERVENSGFSPSGKLHSFLYDYVVEMMSELLASVLLLEEESLSPHLLRQVIERRDRTERFLRRTLAEGMSTGEFREGDPKILTFAILGSINWIPKWYRPGGERSAPEIARQFADYLLAGLQQGACAPSGGAPSAHPPLIR